MKWKFFTLLFSLFILNTYGQDVIKGRVLSKKHLLPIPGASILFLGQKKQIKTDNFGNFSMHTKMPDTLLVTHLGYVIYKQFVNPNKTGVLEILLQEDEQTLNEVIISTGYQKIPKERATGSFTQIDRKTFNQQVGTTILDRLPNIAAAVSKDNLTSTSGFSVRGLSTIEGPKSPLIVLDNFPYYGNLNNLNPNDVESITVLKDAAAASIWGTKAGNGVIVITTKKGKYNQPLKVEFSSSVSIGEKPDLMSLKEISSSDQIDVEQMLFSKGKYNITNAASTRAPVSPVIELLRQAAAGTVSADAAQHAINAYRGKDVRNEFLNHFYRNSLNQQYAINVGSGTEKFVWKTLAGYDRNVSELYAGFNRANLSTQTLIRPIQNLEISGILLLTQSKSISGRPAYGQVSSSAGQIPMYTQFTNGNGNALPLAKDYSLEYLKTAGQGKLLDWNYYPLNDYTHNLLKTSINDIAADASIRYTIWKSMTASVLYRYQRQQTTGSNLSDENSYFTRNLINNFTQITPVTNEVIYKIPKGGILDQSYGRLASNQLRTQIGFDKNWQNHSLNVLAGAEFSEDNTEVSGYRTYGYNNDLNTFGTVDFTNRHPQFATGGLGFIPDNRSITSRLNRFTSVFMNVAYNYKQKYIISVSGRRDGSNLFGVLPNNRFNPLGSVGFAWDISKEDFFKSGTIEYLKIRATYGYSGNTDQSRTAYATISYRPNSPFTQSPYATILNYANPELKWEKVGMLNLAVDFRLKNNRVRGSLEYYVKNAKDLFGRALVDYTGGAGSTIIKNVGAMRGRGIEVDLYSINLRGKIGWYTQLGLNWYRDEVKSYYTSSMEGNRFVSKTTPLVTGVVGKPVYSVFSYAWAGLDSQNGDPRGYINDEISKNYNSILGSGTTINDLIYHGSALPVVYGIFSNTFTYKELSLTFLINYKLGYYFRKTSINYNSLFNGRDGHSDYENRWQKPGDESNTDVPSMLYPAVASRDAFYNSSAATIIKGDHIRLQYINLEYTLSREKQRWLPFRNATVFVNANNLGILWRANNDGIDPDYSQDVILPSMNIAIGLRASF